MPVQSGLRQTSDDPPIVLKDFGSFQVGGRSVELRGKAVREIQYSAAGTAGALDPNGTYLVEHMYVQYFIPANQRGKVPLLLWHGGGFTGSIYETTPDGRPGWLNYFVRQGWAVYNSDAVERGRSGWAQYPDIFKGEPVFMPAENPFGRFRIGRGEDSYSSDPAKRKVNPGCQFPVESYENFMRKIVPRWTTTDAAIIAAYKAEVEKVGPCAIMVHSQSGAFGFEIAHALPDKVKALVAFEPTVVGDLSIVTAITHIPLLILYGDFLPTDPRWKERQQQARALVHRIEELGGHALIVDLPERGITGNTHIAMADRNNLAVAALIQGWLAERGLYE